MKIALINFTDGFGGAAIATKRIMIALRKNGVNPDFLVALKSKNDSNATEMSNPLIGKYSINKNRVARLFCKCIQRQKSNYQSISIFESNWSRYLNESSYDVVHLNWICNEMMSIKDIGRIKKPIVWTLHDMWPITGASHVTALDDWKVGYKDTKIFSLKNGLSLDKYTWKRKKKYWINPINVVCPSTWLADCASKSSVINKKSLSVIFNPIDCSFWRPLNMIDSRIILGLPLNKKIILFGANNALIDSNKGFDLLMNSIPYLYSVNSNIVIVIFGTEKKYSYHYEGLNFISLGKIDDDATMRNIYNAADIMVVPSRIDNFPNTAVEAHSCGLPTVGFKVGGLKDIVSHEETGYLAEPYDVADLARGIKFSLAENQSINLRHNARARALKNFSDELVGGQYLNLYRQAISKHW